MKKRLVLLLFIIPIYAHLCFAQEGYFIVKFQGPVEPEWKSQLEAMNISFLAYISDFSFIAQMDPGIISKVENLSFIFSVTPYKPKYKYNVPDNKVSSLQKSEFYVLLHEGVNLEIVAEKVSGLGVEVLSSEGKLKVFAKYSQLYSIASLEEVYWIEQVPRYVLVNDQAAMIISANTSWEVYGLSGFNQTVAISDSGLDTADDSISDDFRGKVSLFNWYGSSANDKNGHGTHVAGSLAGSGNNSNGQFRGIAYNSHLVMQAIGDDDGSSSVYPPDKFSDMFIQAYDEGARVHSNSWGSASGLGDYTSDSQSVDDFMWNYTHFLVVFSAGNLGPGLNTVAFPSTCKNCLSVGSTENFRPDKGTGADNISEVVSFSSRGPSDDGRVKPDLVAPGTFIVSAKSSAGDNFCNSLYEFNGNYSYCTGTSMSAPIVAGSAAIVREHYSSFGVEPSAALVKATLINGAMDIGYGIPSNHSGWGLINLSESLHPANQKVVNFTDYSAGLSTGDSVSFNFTSYNDSVPLKVTLVWTDYPGGVSANKTLVNDLNLVVVSPDGSVFRGNDVLQPFSDYVDDVNNVEQVNISNLSVGSYLVNVSAFNVPNGPQPFALVVSGPTSISPPVVSLLTPNSSSSTSPAVTLNFSVSDDYDSLLNCSLFLNSLLNETKEAIGNSYFELNLSHGSYSWSVLCNDSSSSSESEVYSFLVDLSPEVVVGSPENITYPYSLVDLNFSVAGYESCWYNLGGENISLENCSNASLLLNESSYSLYLYANNSLGFENFSSADFRVDLTPPLINLDAPADSSSWSSSNTVSFLFQVSDVEVENCSLLVNDVVVLTNESSVPGTQSFYYDLSNGLYNWSVSCSDSASNYNVSQSYSLAVSFTEQQPSSQGSSGGGGGGGGSGGSYTQPACTELWSCSAWSECLNNVQKRVCTDLNGCSSAEKKPLTSRVCVSDTYVIFENSTPQSAEQAVVEEPPKLESPAPQRVFYKLNKLYFYAPLVLILSGILVYVLCKRFLFKRKNL